MKGKKVRVFGKTLGQFVEATGGASLISGSDGISHIGMVLLTLYDRCFGREVS